MSTTPKKQLLRDKRNGKVAGVCAGIANYFNIEVWLVRIVAITAIIFGHGFIAVLYIAMWVILDEKPPHSGGRSHDTIEVKTKVWQAGEAPQVAYREISGEFGEMEQRLQKMERYVTSNAFKIDRELNRL